MAPTSLSLSVELDSAEVSRIWSDRVRDTRPLMAKIGALGMAGMLDRFSSRRRFGDDVVTTGRLTASLLAANPGGGSEHTVFRVTDDRVEVGSNLPYANQVNFGGPILPVTGKALAIPLSYAIKQARKWPRDIDATRSVLSLIPYEKGDRRIGVLIDETGELGFGTDPLYLIVRRVEQPGLHFAEWTDAERSELPDLWHEFLDTAIDESGGRGGN